MLDERRKTRAHTGGRSRILYEITVLVVVLMVASGLAIFLFVNASFNRMVEKSVDKVVDEKAKTVNTGLEYLARIETERILGDINNMTPEQLAELNEAMEEGETSEFMIKATESLRRLVENRVLGLELIFETDAEDRIILATDESLMFTEPPEEVLAALEQAEDEGKTYAFLEGGVPELGLEGEYLMSIYDMSKVGPLLRGYRGFHFVSMHETVADINDYYDSEKSWATLSIGLTVGGSVLLAILITFFVLRMLIRRQITAPIDELSAAAERVMEGDLDVKIEVREGEEFEGLKRAFKEMVESFRKYIAKSVGEE